MKIVKVIILVVITLSALTAIACLGLLSAEDYMIREQVPTKSLQTPRFTTLRYLHMMLTEEN